MNRRDMLSSLGVGLTVAVAGCTEESEPEETGRESVVTSYSELSEKEREKLLEEQLDEVYNKRVSDGQLVHGHNLSISSIDSITDSSVTLETTLSINPVGDYTVNLHYNPITTSSNGKWEYKPPMDRVYGGIPPKYNNETHEWYRDQKNRTFLKYDFEDATPGKKVSSITVPSEAFWDENVTPGRKRVDMGRFKRQDIFGHGWSYINEFELAETPNMYETFVFTLTWTDDNTVSPRGGEVIANSAPIIRVRPNEYVYPRTSNGNTITNPNWEFRGLEEEYTISDIYSDSVQFDNQTYTGRVTRLSNYGSFSPRIWTKYESVGEISMHGSGPAFFDIPPQYPWSISYSISTDEYFEAMEDASAAMSSGRQIDDVYSFLTSDSIMNNEVSKDIASKLGDVCDIMGANHPAEQIRVVADFVQYFAHTSESARFGRPTGGLNPNTSHPIETLINGYGDCKDYTVLGNSILQQDPFNIDTSAIVLPEIYTYISESERDTAVGHVSTAVPVSQFGQESLERIHSPPPGSVFNTVSIDGDEHVYIEMSGPYEIGYVEKEWVDKTEMRSITDV